MTPETQAIRVIVSHPAGANGRAVVSFLVSKGFAVEELDTIASLATCEPAGLLVHAAELQDESDDVLHEWMERASSCPLVAICSTESQMARFSSIGPIFPLREPYFLERVAALLKARDPAATTRPAAKGPDGRGDERRADSMLLPEVLTTVGQSVAAPLAAARGWLNLVVQDLSPGDPVQGHVKHAIREIDQAGHVADLLLLFETVTERRFIRVDVRRLIREVVRDAGPRTVSVDVETCPDAPDVMGDADTLRTAFEALFLAITDPRGAPEKLRISTRWFDGNIEVLFKEFGRGMAPDQLAVLCTPGLSLLYNPLLRGLAYPLAKRIFERHRIPMTVDVGVGGEVRTRVLFDVDPERRREHGPERADSHQRAEDEGV